MMLYKTNTKGGEKLIMVNKKKNVEIVETLTNECDISTIQIATKKVNYKKGYYVVVRLIIGEDEVDLTRTLNSKQKGLILAKLNEN